MRFDLRAMVFLMWAIAAAGCVGELELVDGPGGGPTTGGGTGPITNARQAFDVNVRPALTARTCTACHASPTCATVGDNHCFLGATGEAGFYAAITASTYIGATPATSLITTIGNHLTGNPSGLTGGPAFCGGSGIDAEGGVDAACTADQISLVEDWILLEAGGS
jgi:hypothetical protein